MTTYQENQYTKLKLGTSGIYYVQGVGFYAPFMTTSCGRNIDDIDLQFLENFRQRKVFCWYATHGHLLVTFCLKWTFENDQFYEKCSPVYICTVFCFETPFLISCHFYTNEGRYHRSCQGQKSTKCNYSVTFDLFYCRTWFNAWWSKSKSQIWNSKTDCQKKKRFIFTLECIFL